MDSIPLTPMVKKRLSDYVEDALLHYIESLLQQGRTKLPPEVELAQTLAVSRTTLRSALAELEGKGMVFRLHGKGILYQPQHQPGQAESGLDKAAAAADRVQRVLCVRTAALLLF